MTMTANSQRHLACRLRWFSTGDAAARSSLLLLSHMAQETSSLNKAHRLDITSLMSPFTTDPDPRPYSPHSAGSFTAAKSP
jgi:hypothetical protein